LKFLKLRFSCEACELKRGRLPLFCGFRQNG
jgi:hypothetical protein